MTSQCYRCHSDNPTPTDVDVGLDARYQLCPECVVDMRGWLNGSDAAKLAQSKENVAAMSAINRAYEALVEHWRREAAQARDELAGLRGRDRVGEPE